MLKLPLDVLIMPPQQFADRSFLLMLIVGVVLTYWYIITPLVYTLSTRISKKLSAEEIDGLNYPLPLAAAERLLRDHQDLVAAGFEPLTAYQVHGLGAHVESLRYPYLHRSSSWIALIAIVLQANAKNRILNYQEVQILCNYSTGPWAKLSVTNTARTGPLFFHGNESTSILPQAQHIPQLLALFQRLEQRDCAAAMKALPLSDVYQGDVLKWGVAISEDAVGLMVKHRLLKPAPNSDVYVLPFLSVYWLGWHIWWPMRWFWKAYYRSAGLQAERRLMSSVT